MSLARASLVSSALGGAASAHGAERTARPALLRLARLFHWLSAGLVLGMFASGILMTQLGGGPLADILFPAHKLTGALVLVLLAGRLAYRIVARLRGRWQREIGGRTVHRLLYALAMLVPFLGWAGISDFGARETLFGLHLPKIWPEGLGYDGWLLTGHAWLAFALIGLVLVHIAMALQDYLTRSGAGDIDRAGAKAAPRQRA